MPNSTRGFAGLDKDTLKEMSSRGGKAVHAQGRAYKFTSEKAREAALKGVELRRNRISPLRTSDVEYIQPACIGSDGSLKNSQY